MKNKKRTTLAFMLIISANFFSQTVHSTDNSWRFKLETNLMLPKAKGKTAVAQYPKLEIDQKASDIYSHISYGGMYTIEASNKNWAIVADFMYSSFDATAKQNPLVLKGRLDADQFIGDLSILRKITPWLDAGLGGTLVNVKAGFDTTIVNPYIGQLINLNKSVSKTWVEPMIILRTTNIEDSRFIYTIRGGVGGFGLGSKFAWQAEAFAGYKFSELFYASLGYKTVSFNYKKTSLDDAFLYDMRISGPMLKLGFNMDKLF